MTTQSTRERLGAGLGWFGRALVCAPFAVALTWVVGTRVLGRMPGDAPIEAIGTAPVLTGAIACLPFFLLVPWLSAQIPWFDRTLPGVLVLSLLLSVPAVLGTHLVFRSLPLWPVCIVAIASIAAPRIFVKSMRPGAEHPRSPLR